MAKGQMRSTREKKKPKANKLAAAEQPGVGKLPPRPAPTGSGDKAK